MLGVEMLGRIDCPASSHVLAGVATFGRSRDIQQVAIQALKGRDPRDFVDALIGLMRQPLKFEVRPVGESNEPGVLTVEGETSRSERVYKVPRVVARNPFGPGYIARDSSGRSRIIGPHHLEQFLLESPIEQVRELASYDQMAESYREKAHAATARLHKDLARIQKFNANIIGTNARVSSILGEVTGEYLPADPDTWTAWWNDRIGYRYHRSETPIKPTRTTNVRVYVKLFASCFAAGTPVWTLTGPRSIESLRVGDLVLSQDAATGTLGYEPIVEVHHNPPDRTLQVRLKAETIVCTTYHRFWRPGRGWAMARDLKAGDILRTLDGRAEILAVEPGPEQPVFNLDVARTCTFFVGTQKELVHDNSLPPPVLTPFDAEPSLAAIARGQPGR